MVIKLYVSSKLYIISSNYFISIVSDIATMSAGKIVLKKYLIKIGKNNGKREFFEDPMASPSVIEISVGEDEKIYFLMLPIEHQIKKLFFFNVE